jgi:hypothetical protein
MCVPESKHSVVGRKTSSWAVIKEGEIRDLKKWGKREEEKHLVRGRGRSVHQNRGGDDMLRTKEKE